MIAILTIDHPPVTSFVSTSKAKTYLMDPPWHGEMYVQVSAATVMGEPETYLFPVDAEGNWTSSLEMEGSQKGTLDHEQVLRDIGYEVA